MKNGETSGSAVNHVSKYVGHRLAGANKQESAVLAGYSETTAQKPSLIENTKAYALVVQNMLNKNSLMMSKIMDSINDDINEGTVAVLEPTEKVEIAYKIAKIHDILTPKVTIKETTDKDGNKTRTAWGTGSLQQAQTPADEGNPDAWGNA
jgi:phage terminase small subunit